jgi:hypothetical protein
MRERLERLDVVLVGGQLPYRQASYRLHSLNSMELSNCCQVGLENHTEERDGRLDAGPHRGTLQEWGKAPTAWVTLCDAPVANVAPGGA